MDLYESSLKSLPLIARGKVRDIYAVGEDRMLLVASDRLSAYDVILPTPIPEKGRVLTEVANFWFAKLADIVPNHLTGIDPESVVAPDEREQVRGRSMVVKRLKPILVEAVVLTSATVSNSNARLASSFSASLRSVMSRIAHRTRVRPFRVIHAREPLRI